MTKAAIIISALLVFAGVTAASSLPGLSGGSDTPTLDTPTLRTTTDATTSTEAAEDISGPCDEAEHANDPRCTGVAPQGRDDDDADDVDHGDRNRGPGGGDDDHGDDQGENSGPGGGNSGHGGGDDDYDD
jgi:hypothetical protein